MKKALNIILSVIQILIVIYVILVISFMFISNDYGYSQIDKYVLDVDNDELVIIKKTDDIKIGDLVYYYSVVKEKYKIVYSNVQTINEDKSYILDNGSKIYKNRIIGKTDRKVPVVGFILNRLKEKVNFLLFVLLPIFIVFVYQVYKFIIGINYEKIKE